MANSLPIFKKHFYLYANFRNTDKGLEQLYKWVEKHKETDVITHYVMEATGVYHEKLACFLESKQCNISIILPNKISELHVNFCELVWGNK